MNTGTQQIRCVIRQSNDHTDARALRPHAHPGQRTLPALLIPDAAVNTDQNERYLLIVGANNVVQQRPVKLGALFGNLRSITDGLKPGERVIVNGMQFAQSGAKVIPHEVPVSDRSAGGTGEYRGPAAARADDSRHADGGKIRFATCVEGASMKIAHFFIDRPVFAIVLSIVAIIAGSIAVFTLPIAQYPEIAPPTVTVSATYPGRQRGNRREDGRHAASKNRSTASRTCSTCRASRPTPAT